MDIYERFVLMKNDLYNLQMHRSGSIILRIPDVNSRNRGGSLPKHRMIALLTNPLKKSRLFKKVSQSL